jgi:aminobenzoyl-glutamate transport protein
MGSPAGGGEQTALRTGRLLDWIERAGNRLPDPAFLFLLALLLTAFLSALLSRVQFADIDPRTMLSSGAAPAPIRVNNLLSGTALTAFLARMVTTFVEFPPLGVVLVALLGVGAAEHIGLIGAGLRTLLGRTRRTLLTPMVLLVSIVSHSAADTGYVLIIPLGAAMFAAAGRHPLAGLAAAFAGVSGGYSANFLPSALDPLLQGFTQAAAQILDPGRTVNPLCNWGFTAVSCLLVIGIGWYLTDRIIEPRLARTPVDGDAPLALAGADLTAAERRGVRAAVATMGLGVVLLAAASWSAASPLRGADGSLSGAGAPLMQAIVPLLFLGFLVPAVVYGVIAGTVRSHRDVVAAMTASMNSVGYYLVLAFFAAQFTYAFRESNLGALLAIKGGAALQAARVPAAATIVGIIALSAGINLLVGSASAKWAVLAPIFVPMLMQAGISPELTQAAYRVGDSSTNILTPLLPYFPLVVVYAQRYVRSAGIGTLISLMLPYGLSFLVAWTLLLLGYWATGLPLGLQATYTSTFSSL